MLTEPKLHIFTGPMFSGKTSALLSQYERHRLAGMRVRIFKPRIDDRYNNKTVINHNKNQAAEATLVTSSRDYGFCLQVQRDEYDAIFIDEAQFLCRSIVDEVAHIVRILKKRVFIACLDLDWTREPFRFHGGDGHVGELFAIAQVVEKKTAICRHITPGKGLCGREACYTRKTIRNDKIVEVGGNNIYEPVCWDHWRFPDA